MSKLEEKVITLLKGKYKFEREKTFTDLKGGKYRFDFYILNRRGRPCVLEIQGIQHYQQVKKFQRTQMEFKSQKERDRRKISYCLANQIPIYCIPFWELEQINSVEKLFQDRFIAHDRWKNDKDWIDYKGKI